MTGALWLFHTEDALHHAGDGEDRTALALYPRQNIELENKGWTTLDQTALYTDAHHRRDLEYLVGQLRIFEKRLKNSDFDPALQGLLIDNAAIVLGQWLRFSTMAAGYSSFHYFKNGQWIATSDIREAFINILGSFSYSITRNIKPWERAILWIVNNFLAVFYGAYRKPVIFDCRTTSVFSGFKIPGSVLMKTKWLYDRDKIAMYRRPIDILRFLKWKQPLLTISLERDPSRKADITSYLTGTDFAALPTAFAANQENMIHIYYGAKRYYLGQLPRYKEVKGAFFDDLVRPDKAALAHILQEQGKPTVLSGRGSIYVHGDEYEQKLTRYIAHKGMFWSPAATDFIPRSPLLVHALAKETPPRHIHAAAFFKNIPASNTQHPTSRFRILHAGNYISWDYALPWIAPSDHEYLKMLLLLTQRVEENPNLELIIRIKTGLTFDKNWAKKRLNPKTEKVNPKLFTSLIEHSERISLSNEESYTDALAKADLVISEGLTATMHEALAYGKPVLLLGLSDRFFHMPAQSIPPTPENRAAIYGAGCDENLPAMLEAIRLSHAGKPLTNDELKDYRWPQGTASLQEVLQRLFSPLSS